MKSKTMIITLSIIVSMFFWLLDALVDYFSFYNKPFLNILLFDKKEVFFRLLASSFFIGFGVLLAKAFARQKKSEEELLKVRNYLHTIIEKEPDCVKLLARDGTLLKMNRAGLDMIEADSFEQVKGASIYDLMPQEYCQGFKELTESTFEGGSGTMEFEMTGMKGRNLWLETNAVPLRDAKGEIFASLGITRDITGRKQAEQEIRRLNQELQYKAFQLEQSYKDLDSFTYTASHDLREPLVVIEWFSANMLKKYEDILDDDAKESMTVIRDRARQMTQLIKDLLSFAHTTSKDVVRTSVDMQALANNVFAEIKPAAAGRDIRLNVKDLPAAWGDQSMLHQVFTNLLSNALKYTRSTVTTIIEIGGSAEQKENIYYVKDNETGFNEEDAAKLFSPFHRLQQSEELEGTGLGLAITQKILEKHGGRIWAEGRVNEGATFYFSLPEP